MPIKRREIRESAFLLIFEKMFRQDEELDDIFMSAMEVNEIIVNDEVKKLVENVCEKQDEIRRARLLLDGLPARERQIILLRYGLAGQPPLTQLEVAGLLNISRSYVSRLETHALELLRQRWNAPDTKTAQR